jgi:hypothetical protein
VQSAIRLILVAVLAFFSGSVLAAAPVPRGTYGNDDLILQNVPCTGASCDTVVTPTLPIGNKPVDSCQRWDERPPVAIKIAPINIAGGAIGLGGRGGAPAIRRIPPPANVPVVAVLVERCTHYPKGAKGAAGQHLFSWQVVKIPWDSRYEVQVHTERSPAP